MSLDGNWIRKNESREFEEEVFRKEILREQELRQQPLKHAKKELFDKLVNNGIDRVLAYQVAYQVSHEEAIRLVNGENYLVSNGISSEMAREIGLLSSEESNSKTR